MLSALPYPSPDSITIFISYAQEDKRWYGKLKMNLTPVERGGAIILLSGEKIPPGTSASSFITKQMDAAQIILLLLSPSFLASEKCMAETALALYRAQNESVRLMPLMLEKFADADWEETELGQLSPLPEDGRFIRSTPAPDTTLVEVAKSILAVAKTMRQHPSSERLIGSRPLNTPPPLPQIYRVQRLHLVQQIYNRLTKPDTSALVLVGMGGIGKSALAALLYEYAEQQRLAGTGLFTGKALRFQVDATVTLADIIGAIREEWQLPTLNLASMTTAKQLQEFSRMLQATQGLIVLDQFEELLDPQTGVAKTGISEWLDMLSTHAFAAHFLFTARFSPHVTHHAAFLREYEVPPLTLEEGEAFLRLHGNEVSEGEMRLAIEYCQGHALALLLIGQILKKDPSIGLTDLFAVHSLSSQQRINSMADKLLERIFTQQLNQDQRDLLSAFAVYREAVPIEAAQAVVPMLSLERISRAHTVLLAQHLLQPMGEKRYRSHRLIGEFALREMEQRPEQKKPTLMQSAHIKAALYYRQQPSQPQPFGKQRKGRDGVHNIIEAIWHLCQAKRQRAAYALIVQENLFATLQRWGNSSVILELYQYLDPSQWKPSPAIAARIYNETGEIYQAIGSWQNAGNNFSRALSGFRALNQYNDMVCALNNLGIAYHQQGQIEEALACYKEAQHVSEQAQEKITGSGITLNNLGYIQATLGHQARQCGEKDMAHEYYRQALELYLQAVPLHQAVEHYREEARTLNNIGEIEQMLGRDESASAYYQQALTLARAYEERWIEAMALNGLGVLAKKRQDAGARSLDYYKQALTIFRAIGARESEHIVLKNMGYWYLTHQQHETALACFVLARTIAHELAGDNEEELPWLVLRELKLLLGKEALQLLRHDIEARAEQIIEQVLIS